MSVIRQSRQRTTQPQGQAGISARWMTGLRAAFVFFDKSAVCPITGTIVVGSGVQEAFDFGSAYHLNSSYDHLNTLLPQIGGQSLFADADRPFSVVIKYRSTGTGIAVAKAGASLGLRTFAIYNNGAAAAPSVNVRGTVKRCNWNYQDGAWHTVTVTWGGGATASGVSIYGDTDRAESMTRGSAEEEVSEPIMFGARTSGPNFTLIGGDIAHCFIFDRAISRDEHIALCENPYQIFEARNSRLVFGILGGLSNVSTDGSIRWDIQSAVTNASAIRWAMLQPVQADSALRWSMLQPATAEAITRWSMLAAVTANESIRWDALSSVQQDRDVAWQLLQAAQSDAALRWSMLDAVQADAAILWNLAATLGTVTSDFVARWSALAPVTADASLHWHLLNAVARDIALPWHVVQTIASDSALRWALVTSVQSDVTAAWRLVTALSADSTLAWDVAAAVGVVSASLSLHWSLVARVQQSISARWSLLASVGADADMRWDIVTGVMREITASWEVIAQLVASNSLDLSWSLIAVSESDLVIRWQVGEVFDLVVRKRFVAGASIRREFVA